MICGFLSGGNYRNSESAAISLAPFLRLKVGERPFAMADARVAISAIGIRDPCNPEIRGGLFASVFIAKIRSRAELTGVRPFGRAGSLPLRVAVKADVAATISELPVEVAMALIADLASLRLITRATAL